MASDTTDAMGIYGLIGLPFGAYTVTPTKTGDVNSISSLDASLVARASAGLTALTANQIIAADVSNNGTISSTDASLIARTASLIANPGIAGTWKFSPASRSYPNLISNQTAQNFDAILMGEVTGNWTPPGPRAPAEQSQEQESEETQRLFALNLPTDVHRQANHQPSEQPTFDSRQQSPGQMGDQPEGISPVAVSLPYRFADVPAGGTYVFNVSARNYTFNQNAQVRTVSEDINDINFVADDSNILR